jgi:hypothetical protein
MSKPKIISANNPTIRRGLLIAGAFVLGFAVLAVAGIQLWEWSNSTDFCTNVCHDVHPEEPIAYQDSYHARVKCVECHMGRAGTLRNMALKVTHARHLPETILHQYVHPLEAATLRPASESCERCHWPPSFHGDTVWEITQFQPDEQNTASRTYLILKTGGGEPNRGLGYGIHWHIENPVRYIAADERKQDIRWVQVILPDGRTVEYNDVTNPLPAEEIAAAKPRTMDCVNCHNRVGHPFSAPEQLIDQAMTEGRISADLPYVKAELLALLTADYANQQDALAAVDALPARYQTDHPEEAAAFAPGIEQAVEVAKELVTRIVFEDPGVTWQSFPNETGHKYFPGCFRCHDGKHLSAEGESIRLHCNICHSIPVTVGAEDRAPQVPVVSLHEPASHLETNFMADHRFQANAECATCHGEVTFGSDDSNFCSNSACHGQTWPSVNLDASSPHTIPLVGKHADVWCYQCHEGVRRPEYVCANCHEPPTPTHFGSECSNCHTPEGWAESAAAVVAGSPEVPHTLEGRTDCLMCHDPSGDVQPAPADHEGRTSGQCRLCHQAEQ